MATMSPLRRRMIEDMTIRNLSRSTQQSYIYAVAKFSRHFNCPPDRLGMEDVRAYQLHLVHQKYSWSHTNQVAGHARPITLARRRYSPTAVLPTPTASAISRSLIPSACFSRSTSRTFRIDTFVPGIRSAPLSLRGTDQLIRMPIGSGPQPFTGLSA